MANLDDRDNPFAKFVQPSAPDGENPFAKFVGQPSKPTNSAGKTLRDVGVDFAGGLGDIGKQAYGLANFMSAGTLDPATRKLGAIASEAITPVMNYFTGQNVDATSAADAPSIAQGLQRNDQAISDLHSDYRKMREQQRSTAIQNADGVLAETGAAIKETLSNPSLLLGDVVRSAPSMLAPAAAGRKIATTFGPEVAEAAATRALAGGATREAAMEAGQQAVDRLAERAVIGVTGLGQVGGGANIDTINALHDTPTATLAQNPEYQLLRLQGKSEVEARDELARKAGLTAAAIAAPMSMAASKLTGAGEQLAKVATGRYGAHGWRQLGIAMGKEAAQEYPESFGEQYGQGNGLQLYGDPNTDPTKGAYSAAAMGALAGGVMGAGEHVAGWALHRGQPQSEAATGGNAPTQETAPPDSMPPANPTVPPGVGPDLAPNQGWSAGAAPVLSPDAGPLEKAASLAPAAPTVTPPGAVAQTIFPFSDRQGAQKQADRFSIEQGRPFEVGDHPQQPGRFAALPVQLDMEEPAFVKHAKRLRMPPLLARMAAGDDLGALFDAMRDYYPEITLQQWRKPQERAKMAAQFVNHEVAQLGQMLGETPTPTQAYLARQVGVKATADMLTMSDTERSLPLASVVPDAALTQRLGLDGMTVGDALTTLTSRADAKLAQLKEAGHGDVGTGVSTANQRIAGGNGTAPVGDAGRAGTVDAGPTAASGAGPNRLPDQPGAASGQPVATDAVATQPPRTAVGAPDGWLNQNAQVARDEADRRGLTQGIEDQFAQGLTVAQVQKALGNQLDYMGKEDRPGFLVQVRATLGIPSQMDADGKREFAAWKTQYEARKAAQVADDPATIAARLAAAGQEEAAPTYDEDEADTAPAVTKKERAPAGTFQDRVTDAYSGQVNHSLSVKDADGAVRGTLDYSDYNGEPSITMIDVPEESQRQGYATQLVQELQRSYPETEIDWGMMTDEGAALRKSLPQTQQPTEHAPAFERLQAARQERDDRIEQADKLHAKGTLSEADQAQLAEVTAPLNGLHDEITDLEYQLLNKRPSKTLFGEAPAPSQAFDRAAHAAATSPQNDLPVPSQAQQDAGNGIMGHATLHGLPLTISHPVGAVRSGTDQSGKAWETTMQSHYGYIKGTRGADKDHIDTFIGPNPDSDKVFVVDQTNPATGKFDEHKIMLGYDSQGEADDGYHANYPLDWEGGKTITETTVDGFKQWLKEGDTTKQFAKPAADDARRFMNNRLAEVGRKMQAEKLAVDLGLDAKNEADTLRGTNADGFAVRHHKVREYAYTNIGNYAQSTADEFRANPELYAKLAKVTPDEVRRFADVIEQQLASKQKPVREKGQAAPASGATVDYPNRQLGFRYAATRAEEDYEPNAWADITAANLRKGDTFRLNGKQQTVQSITDKTLKLQDADGKVRTFNPDGVSWPQFRRDLASELTVENLQANNFLKPARPLIDILKRDPATHVDAQGSVYLKDGGPVHVVPAEEATAPPPKQDQGVDLHAETGHSSQFDHYAQWIKDGKPVPAGMVEQIEADERLHEGEAEALLAMRATDQDEQDERDGENREGPPAENADAIAHPDKYGFKGKLPKSLIVKRAVELLGDEAKFMQLVQQTFKDMAAEGFPVLADEHVSVVEGVADSVLAGVFTDKPAHYWEHPEFDTLPELEDKEFPRKNQPFPAPAATVSMAKQLQGEPMLTQKEADQRVAAWKAEAQRIGREQDNSKKVVISLFDRTGLMSQPYEDAGYTVFRYDIERGDNLLKDFPLADIRNLQESGHEIVGVIAQPPCTSFAVSGAHSWASQHDIGGKEGRKWVEKKYGHWASMYFDKPLDLAVTLVHTAEVVVELANPSQFYVLENPVGRIAEMADLPAPTMRIQPHHFGNAYTKHTQLWGEFNTDLPTAPVSPKVEDGGEGSRIADKLRGSNAEQKLLRSVTPEGFAYAFFMANHQEGPARVAEDTEQKPAPAVAQAPQEAPEAPAPAVAEVAPAEPEVATPTQGKVIERYAGKYGNGMAEANAQMRAANQAKAHPEFTYTVEDASDEFGPAKYVVVQREKVAAPAPAPTPAPEPTPEPTPAPVAPTDALALARANNTFTGGQTAGAGSYAGHTQPKGTPSDKLFSNFADPLPAYWRDQTGRNRSRDVVEQERMTAFREKMFDRATQSPRQYTNDLMLEHTEAFGPDHHVTVAATTQSGYTRVLVMNDTSGDVVAGARIERGKLDAIAVAEAARGQQLGLRLLKYLDAQGIANVYEVPDRSPGFVKIQKALVAAQEQPGLATMQQAKAEKEQAAVQQAYNEATQEKGNDSTKQGNAPALDPALDAGPATPAVPPAEPIRGAILADAGTGPDDGRGLRAPGGRADGRTDGGQDLGHAGGDAGIQPAAPANVVRRRSAVSAPDYRPSVADLARSGSWRDTAARNVAIIELALNIQSEQRPATPAEQAQLAKYVGFGAGEMRNALFPVPSAYARQHDRTRLIWPNLVADAWRPLAERLDKLPREWQESILQSTQYAHYTSAPVIQAIWNGVQRLGFTGGKVLEPGMGIGSFNMLMPDTLHATSRYTGIEFDGPTALIAHLLSPEQNMLHDDFITRRVPKNYFDLAIGNPPFSATKIVSDPEYAKQNFALHDYFFAKSIDRVRPGGLLVFVTSRYTMDKASDKARKYLADRADLVGAVRLPQTAFAGNAGTSVVTDVLFLRKRLPGEAPAGVAWNGLGELTTKDGKVLVNQYYAEHPDMILGQPRLSGHLDDQGRRISGLRGEGEFTVVSYDTDSAALEAKFAAAMDKLPQNVYSLAAADRATTQAEVGKIDFDPSVKREGVLYVGKDGTLLRVTEGVGQPLASVVDGKLSPKDMAWLRDYVALRDMVRVAQQDQFNDGPWEKSLKALNKAYDKFVQAHGPLLDYRTQSRTSTDADGEEQVTTIRISKNRRLYRNDYDASIVTALETITEDGSIHKAPFLLDRTIGKPVQRDVRTVGDALAVSLDSLGRLDVADVAARLKLSQDEAIAALGDQIYLTPQGQYQMADEYLSGDVVEKLAEAEAAAADNPALQRNVQALIAAQPQRLGPSQITVKLGASWVPAKYVNAFANHIDAGAVEFHPATEMWSVAGAVSSRGRTAGAQWGTAERSPSELLDAILNSRVIQVRYGKGAGPELEGKVNGPATTQANEVAKRIRAEFQSWVWRDTDRATDVVDIYNRIANNIAPRRFDGSHLTLPGVSMRYNLFPHQKRAIWRIIASGDTYLAHAVGAGKTIEMIAAGMEQKRLGLVKKPMYVVPNHMLEQFANEFMELYPLANIMVADDDNFTGERRRAFVAAATLNAPDAIILTHSAFKRISVKEESVKAIRDDILVELEMELDEVAHDNGQRVRRSQLEQQIEAVKQRFAKIMGAGSKDNTIKFEDIGVDQLIVDEAHTFRKLDFSTAQQIKGIDPNGSQAALDMYVKTRHLQGVNPGRAMVFASGTPVTNTMGELYTIMRYFAPKMMDDLGIASFDAWSRAFGDVVAALEPNASGKYETVERFAKFVNLPELMSRVRSFMDVLTSEQLGGIVKRPDVEGGKPKMMIVPMSPQLKAYMTNVLTPRLEASKKWKPSPQEPFNKDPVMNIITDGRFAALDPRYFRAKLADGTPTKLTAMADEIVKEYHATSGDTFNDPHRAGKREVTKGSTQIVFYNLGFGGSAADNRGFDARAELTRRLVAGGVKRSHIAWFDDANTDAKKEAIFKDMRSGQVRVLIGSAKKMGTGVNVQKRLSALHYFDAPWYPADVEQPHGRILRQGNQHGAVRLFWYATKGTYDETMWQMVARKQRFIDQAFAGDVTLRTMEDVSPASLYEQAAAVSSGDPRAVQLAGLRLDVERFENLYTAHYNEQLSVRDELRYAELDEKALHKSIDRLERANKLLDERYVSFNGGTIGKRSFDKAGEFGEALVREFNDSLELAMLKPHGVELGSLGKATLRVEADFRDRKPTGGATLYVTVGDISRPVRSWDGPIPVDASGAGITSSITSQLNGIATDLTRDRSRLADRQETLARGAKKLGAPFPYAQELAEKIKELRELEDQLLAEGKAPVTPTPTQDAPPDDAGIGRSVTDTPAFRTWFGESKVVDDSGAPLVVYHGTTPWEKDDRQLGNIQAFDRLASVNIVRRKASIDTVGSWFSTNPGQDGAGMYGDTIYPVYLAIKDPYETTFASMLRRARLLANGVDDGRMVGEAEVNALRKWLQETGRDGIRIVHDKDSESTEFAGQDGWIALEPQQVKSAIGNSGAFDPDDARIVAQPPTPYGPDGTPEYNDPYDHTETRPGTTAAQLDAGRSAVAALAERIGAARYLGRGDSTGGGGRVLGQSLLDNFVAGRPNQLLGHTVTSPADLATLAQVYRDPRFETFRVVFMQGTRVVGETGYTSRVPAAVTLGPSFAAQLAGHMRAFGADGYYVMHNHPSGEATPSDPDIGVTKALANKVPGMLAHVIIDHNEYGVVKPNGQADTVRDWRLNGVDFHGNPPVPHAMLGHEISGFEDVANLGKALQVPDGHATLVLTSKSKVVLMVDVPMAALMDTSPQGIVKGRAMMRALARASGGNSLRFIVLPDGADPMLMQKWARAGVVTDVVTAGGMSLAEHHVIGGAQDYGDNNKYALRVYQPPSQYGGPSPFNRPPAEVARNAGRVIKAQTYTRVANALIDKRNIGLQFLGRRQLVELYARLFNQKDGTPNPMQEVQTLTMRMDAEINDAGATADALAVRWGKVKDADALAEVMHDATLAQFDPRPNRRLPDSMLTPEMRALRQRFNGLSDEARKVFSDSAAAYQAHYKAVRLAIRNRIIRALPDHPRRAELLRQMDAEMFGQLQGIYFPLARFGEYVVRVQGPDGAVAVSRTETLSEAEALRKDLLREYEGKPGHTVMPIIRSKEFNAARDAVGRGFLQQLYGAIEASGDERNTPELLDAINQLYLTSLPDLSWAKHGLHRKGTPGYSQNARRAFAHNMFHGARYLAKLHYADRLTDSLDGMQEHIDANANDPKFDQVKAQQVMDEMVKRHDIYMNPKTHPLANWLTSAGFVFYLGLSPASAAVNLSQTALVAYPILGGKFGYGKAGAALLQASKDAMSGHNDMAKVLKDDELAAYNHWVKIGLIDVSMAHDLAGIAQGQEGPTNRYLGMAMKAASFMFHHAERFNRQATALAAYRLAREQGMNHQAAMESAVADTYAGHFDYSQGNRPRLMQGNVARVLLLFKQYAQNMVYTFVHNTALAFKGDRQALKTVAGLLTTHALAAGVLGLPMVTTLLAAASLIGGSDDDPWDAQVALRNMFAEVFGDTAGEALSHGLSRLTPWDISSRVGLDRLLLPDVQEGLEGQRFAESAMTGLLGPMAGLTVNLAKGMHSIAEGQVQRGLEEMAPAFMRGPLRAVRYFNEGVQDRTGVDILPETTLAEDAGQLLGFSPSRAREAQEGKSAIYRADKALQERRQSLMNQFAHAQMEQEDTGPALEAIQAFNLLHPNRQIAALHLQQSVRARMRRLAEAEQGVFLPKTRSDARAAGAFANPNE